MRYIVVSPKGQEGSFPERRNKTENIVARFCSKCGAELSSGAQSCASCGAPVAGAAAAFPPVQLVAGMPVAVPPKSGSSALKVVPIIVAVFVGLGLIVAGAFGYYVFLFAQDERVAESDKHISVNVPCAGGFSASTSETFSAADLGAYIYPGATQVEGGVRTTLPTGTTITAVYVTCDSKDDVARFYKHKFGSDASLMMASGEWIVSLKKSDQDSVMVTITENSSEAGGKTRITIVHTTTPKPS